MLGDASLVAFVGCADLDEAERFYGGVLGLPLVDSSEFARVFDANGTRLRVTHVDEVAAARYTVLGWRVDDVVAAMRELRVRGVAVERYDGLEQDADGVWTAPSGSRVAWFLDPAGNTISLEQPPR